MSERLNRVKFFKELNPPRRPQQRTFHVYRGMQQPETTDVDIKLIRRERLKSQIQQLEMSARATNTLVRGSDWFAEHGIIHISQLAHIPDFEILDRTRQFGAKSLQELRARIPYQPTSNRAVD